MPYKKPYKKYNKTRKAWYDKQFTPRQIGSMALSAASGVKYLKSIVNSERHYHTRTADLNPSSTGQVVHLTDVGQDDTSTGRTGNSILLRGININLECSMNASITNGETYFRIIVFKDNQQIGDTTPAVTDILESAKTSAFLNQDHAGRFQILKNYYFSLDSIKGKSRIIRHYINQHLHVRWNGINGSDIQKNGIYILFLSDEPTNTPSVNYNIKLGWHDN